MEFRICQYSTLGNPLKIHKFVVFDKKQESTMYIIDNIQKVLKIQGVTQKYLLESLGLAPTAFVDWRRGKSSSYKKYLPQIAELLGVTQECLMEEKLDESKIAKIPKAVYAKTYECEIVNSLRTKESMLSESELNEIANYIGCNIAYLYGMQSDSQAADLGREINSAEMNVKLLAILMSLSASESYRTLQIQISRKIISHIQNWEIPITADIMKTEIGINAKRVDFLCSNKSLDMRSRYDVGLNISDLDRLNEKYGISYTYMFTGKN